jgi:glycosyltransferase involved in cell wall biosynthesis
VKLAVGIHVHERPADLAATLASLAADAGPAYELLLLGDGPDAETAAALLDLGVEQSSTVEPLGAAACFNRLAGRSEADTIVLLESGCVVAPDWLERLLAGLGADPRNGIAGPSTNRSWNEQCSSAEAAARLGGETRTLEPLHSLADFCYAVRREVVETIGAADEGYGLGPCWEMDYNVRAARAGFRGVWVCGAYVHRLPFTERREREEAARMAASKRRYQDSFCGLRLRGERSDYEEHCRGDACEHFAPPGLVGLVRSAPGIAPRREPLRPAPAQPREGPPLVSCIMPTRDRADFALQAIRYFQRQDYPARELVIVDDGSDGLAGRLPDDARVRYLRAPAGESIGAKRNRACAAAAGELVAHWDDDDWYAPSRLRTQIEPLLADDADITAFAAGVFFDLPSWAFWTCSPRLHRRLFVEDVHGGTLVYRRRVWEQLARYPDVSLAEDAHFLRRAVRRRARLQRVANDGQFVYLRHAVNSWSFPCGTYLDPAGWHRSAEPGFPAADRAFYAERSDRATAGPDAAPGLPLVTCVLPTADRRAYVAQSIEYFLRQDYPNKELLVLDDGGDRVEDLVPEDPSIRYVGLDRRLVLGAKRNLACELARGDLIGHWDDDDWSAPHRLSYQVAELERAGADVCGVSRQLYFDPVAHRSWLYRYPGAARRWLAGNALLYRRSLWERNRFPEIGVGEDTRFVFAARQASMLDLPDHRFYVALVHSRNTSPKRTDGAAWHTVPVEEVEELLGADLQFYRSLA